MIVNLYRDLIPSSFRQYIYDNFLGSFLHFIRHFQVHFKGILVYLFQWVLPKTEENLALAFIGKHGITSYPAPYSLEYLDTKVEVLLDAQKDMHFVYHNNKKLYFTRQFSIDKITNLYISLITEQDMRSAHRYVVSYEELRGMTLLDVGSAEGIFSLDTIELVEHVYLFECEKFWIEALNATFEPWKNKVTIVEKYVGDKTVDNFITIDDFIKDKKKDSLFIKMDIEGAEQSALKGGLQSLKNGSNIHVAVCTYHRENDPKEINDLLKSLGFSCEYSDGLLFWGKRLSKALIRAKK